jgi:two-component system, cell cycle sensor histidine kinase and response regulator CckA
MHDAGGVLEVRSEERLGTELTLFFPYPAESDGAVPEPAPETAAAGHALVVDDDPAHLEHSSHLLKLAGYQVHPANGVAAAIELCAARRERGERRFDVAVIDLMLGEVEDGVDLFRRLRDIEPQLAGILMSGFADLERLADARKLGLVAHLQKPLTREALSKALRATITPH